MNELKEQIRKIKFTDFENKEALIERLMIEKEKVLKERKKDPKNLESMKALRYLHAKIIWSKKINFDNIDRSRKNKKLLFTITPEAYDEFCSLVVKKKFPTKLAYFQHLIEQDKRR